MEKHEEVHCSNVASLLAVYKKERNFKLKEEIEIVNPCPEQLQPSRIDSPQDLEGVLQSFSNPPSLS